MSALDLDFFCFNSFFWNLISCWLLFVPILYVSCVGRVEEAKWAERTTGRWKVGEVGYEGTWAKNVFFFIFFCPAFFLMTRYIIFRSAMFFRLYYFMG